MRQSALGVLCGVGSAVFASGFYVAAGYLSQFMSLPTLLSVWFTWGLLMTLCIGAFLEKKDLASKIAVHWKAGLITGAANIITAAAFFASVSVIGPTETAFIGKLEIVFVVFLAFIFLRERLNPGEIAGIALALAGGLVFAFSTDELSANSYLGVIAAMALAVNILFARRYAQKKPIIILKIWRTGVSAAAFTLFALLTASYSLPEPGIIAIAGAGALTVSVIAVGLHYMALKRLKAPVVSIIASFDPILVAIYSYPLFGTLMTAREWAGGVMIIAGVAITVLNMGHSKNYKRMQHFHKPR